MKNAVFFIVDKWFKAFLTSKGVILWEFSRLIKFCPKELTVQIICHRKKKLIWDI